MYSIYAQNGDVQYNIVEFIIDSEEDVATLPTTPVMGSTALVINNPALFMLNSEKEWVKIF